MDELAALRRRRGLAASGAHPRHVMEAVYASGALSVSPNETLTRIVVRQLQLMGLLVAEEILRDGGLREITPATMASARERPWRVSRPRIGDDADAPQALGLV